MYFHSIYLLPTWGELNCGRNKTLSQDRAQIQHFSRLKLMTDLQFFNVCHFGCSEHSPRCCHFLNWLDSCLKRKGLNAVYQQAKQSDRHFRLQFMLPFESCHDHFGKVLCDIFFLPMCWDMACLPTWQGLRSWSPNRLINVHELHSVRSKINTSCDLWMLCPQTTRIMNVNLGFRLRATVILVFVPLKLKRSAWGNPPSSLSLDSLSTKCNLQRKLKPNATQISQPMTDGVVANSPLLIGFHKKVMLGLSFHCT